MKRLLIFLLYPILVIAQNPDSIKSAEIEQLRTRIDSLNQSIKLLKNEIKQIKKNNSEKSSDFEQIITFFNDSESDSLNIDQRSRNKRVDALLNAVLQRPGKLRFNGGATVNFHSGDNLNKDNSTVVGSFDFYAHTSFSSNTILFFDLEAVGGNGPSEFYETFSGLNDDAGTTQDEDGTDRITLLEAWYEFTLLNKSVTITAGKIDLTNYFDNNAFANDETHQFISSAFVNSTAFTVPSNSPGLRVRTTFLNRFHFQFGLSNSHNSGENLFKNIYRIASVSFRFATGTGFESNMRFYGFQHLADYSFGWGLSFDKVFLNKYNFFVRYGNNQNKLADFGGIKSSWSSGSSFVTSFLKENTVMGLAYGESNSVISQLKTEKLIELYVRFRLNKWINFSPHFQYVANAAGSSKSYSFVSARTHFNF